MCIAGNFSVAAITLEVAMTRVSEIKVDRSVKWLHYCLKYFWTIYLLICLYFLLINLFIYLFIFFFLQGDMHWSPHQWKSYSRQWYFLGNSIWYHKENNHRSGLQRSSWNYEGEWSVPVIRIEQCKGIDWVGEGKSLVTYTTQGEDFWLYVNYLICIYI